MDRVMLIACEMFNLVHRWIKECDSNSELKAYFDDWFRDRISQNCSDINIARLID